MHEARGVGEERVDVREFDQGVVVLKGRDVQLGDEGEDGWVAQW